MEVWKHQLMHNFYHDANQHLLDIMSNNTKKEKPKSILNISFTMWPRVERY